MVNNPNFFLYLGASYIITNKDIIAIDQDTMGIQGIRVIRKDGPDAWKKPLSNDRGQTWEPIGLPEMKGGITGDIWEYGWTGVMDI